MKLFVKIILILLLLFVTFLGIQGYLFWDTWNSKPAPVVETSTLSTESAHLGEEVTCKATLELPWYQKVTTVMGEELPDSIQTVGETKIEQISYSPKTCKWNISKAVQPVSMEAIPEFTLRVQIENLVGKKRDGGFVLIKFPGFKVSSSLKKEELDSNLHVAGKVDATASSLPKEVKFDWMQVVWIMVGLFSLAILITFAILYYLKRKARVIVIPAWQIATSELNLIEKDLPMEAELFFVRTFDVLMSYIQKRFKIPATEQTTAEFIHSIKHSSQLDRSHQDILTQFSMSANMIKFAKADSSQEQMTETLSLARTFVSDTIPSATLSEPEKKEVANV